MNLSKITKARLEQDWILVENPDYFMGKISIEKERDGYTITFREGGKATEKCYATFKELKDYLKQSKILETFSEF